MHEGEKNGGNGAADLLTVDILASRVQSALGRLQAATEAVRRLRGEAKKLARRSRPVAAVRLSSCVADAETYLETAESDLHVANYLANQLPNLPKPVDEGDRRLRQAILIAASGGFPSLPDDLSRPTRKQRSPGRPKPTRWKNRGAG